MVQKWVKSDYIILACSLWQTGHRRSHDLHLISAGGLEDPSPQFLWSIGKECGHYPLTFHPALTDDTGDSDHVLSY